MAETATLALREQFRTPAQQRETATFGMWIFIITEAMLFGGMFTAYAVYYMRDPQGFIKGSGEMEYLIGAVNTAILICSGLTMTLAIYFAGRGKEMRCALLLLSTMLIGGIFLALKFYEYYLHYREHKVPGLLFEESGSHADQVQLFFVFYFLMTGLHAIHMLIGLGILTVMVYRSVLGSITAEYHTPIDVAGLYWHFIDVVWVFLFAIFYVPGAHLK